MIEIIEKTTDKDTGNVSVSFRVDRNQKNIFNKLDPKQEKNIDKPEETVILKKTRSRKPKKTTGG